MNNANNNSVSKHELTEWVQIRGENVHLVVKIVLACKASFRLNLVTHFAGTSKNSCIFKVPQDSSQSFKMDVHKDFFQVCRK